MAQQPVRKAIEACSPQRYQIALRATTPLQRALLTGALLLELAWLGFLVVLAWKR